MRVTGQDIGRFLQGKPTAYVVVYADWCGHCKTMLQAIRGNVNGSPLVMFIEQKSLAYDLNIKGFPTVIVYQNGMEVGRHHDTRQVIALVNQGQQRKVQSRR